LLFQSSVPLAPSLAAKYVVPARSPNEAEESESPVPAVRSFTGTVPAAVPSLFHSSRPIVSSSAAKRARLPVPTNGAGIEPVAPAKTSCSRTVPAAVPSLVQGSTPLVPSLAPKNSRLPTAVNPEPEANRSPSRQDVLHQRRPRARAVAAPARGPRRCWR
jgi:hypothetical protein